MLADQSWRVLDARSISTSGSSRVRNQVLGGRVVKMSPASFRPPLGSLMWISGGLLEGTRGVLRSLGEDGDLALLSWSPGGKSAFARKSAVRTSAGGKSAVGTAADAELLAVLFSSVFFLAAAFLAIRCFFVRPKAVDDAFFRFAMIRNKLSARGT